MCPPTAGGKKKWYLNKSSVQFSSVLLLSCVRLFVTPCTTARQASLSITNSRSLLKLISMESVMLSNHVILGRPLLLPPSIFPCIRVFSSESALCIRWPMFWSFSFSISPSNNIRDWFSFRIDWFESKRLSRVFSNTTVQKHQFFSPQAFLWSNSHIHIWLLEKPLLWLYGPVSAKWYICFVIHCLGLS